MKNTPRFSYLDLYELFRKEAFPGTIAETFTAIAMRESSGDPTAFNNNADTHDLSYGLVQINLYGDLGNQRLPWFQRELGLKRAEDLFDPIMNARAAHLIWGGSYKNLEIGWAIHLTPWKERYEAHLIETHRAALLSPWSLKG